ncbi:Tartrate-resistant acid phosphatase type 5 [Terramyces sp. JEL0728]|nr:Tartrate-resistant acid phosphatase type 5 [Terramyces sp. JEL0728]
MVLLAYFNIIRGTAAQKVNQVTTYDQQVKFQVVGDWGSTTRRPTDYIHQKVVGKTMSTLADTDETDFIISLGDNFYGSSNNSDNGVASINDPKWNYDWLDVYSGDRINSIPWYAILGNHDWYQNQAAQIAYTNVNNRWFMDDYFYSRNITVGSAKAAFIFISTDLIYYGYDGYSESGLAPKATGTDTDNNMRNNFIALGWTPENDTINKQLSLIESLLEANQNADYLFVAGHEDMVTCGTVSNMVPLYNLFQKYKITAYLYGHAHELAYKQDGPVFYLQSGAGGRAETCNKSNATWITKAQYGFANVKLTASSGSVDFYNENGTILTSTLFSARSATNANAPAQVTSSSSTFGYRIALLSLLVL